MILGVVRKENDEGFLKYTGRSLLYIIKISITTKRNTV